MITDERTDVLTDVSKTERLRHCSNWARYNSRWRGHKILNIILLKGKLCVRAWCSYF